VALPEPIPGLVIRYSYLWLREHLQGREEGQKDRPCAIVAAVKTDAGDTRVVVLPVTHSAPDDPDLAVEIPLAVKQRLRLDGLRSWVVVSEWNEFIWPGPDLRRIFNADDSSIAYGVLPPNLFRSIRERLAVLIKSRNAGPVDRS
jgi:hypothetical protein